MPGHGTVSDGGRALADVDHVLDPAATFISTAMRFTHGPSSAQTPMQFAAQVPFALNINRQIDGLVRHPHLRIIREVDRQPRGDLLGAVLFIFQPGLHLIVQTPIGGQLAWPAAAGIAPRLPMGLAGPIPRPGIPATTPTGTKAIPRPIASRSSKCPIAVDLAHHRRWGAAQPTRDRTDRFTPGDPILDLFTFLDT